MKLFALPFLLLPYFLTAQVIDTTTKDYVVFKDGTRQEIEITDEDKNYIHVIARGKENKIQKAGLQSWYNGNLWEQPFKYNEEGLIEYTEIIQVPGVGKDELYNRARRMYAVAFNDSKEVLEMDDREAGNLIGTGWVKIPFVRPLGMSDYAEFWMTIEIAVKDGRYKYSISNLKIRHPYNPRLSGVPQDNEIRSVERKYPPDMEYNVKMHKQLKSGMLLAVQGVVDEIKKAMTGVKKEKDW